MSSEFYVLDTSLKAPVLLGLRAGSTPRLGLNNQRFSSLLPPPPSNTEAVRMPGLALIWRPREQKGISSQEPGHTLVLLCERESTGHGLMGAPAI
jgi:hypothetical protein